jgi:hypothetical protein
LGQVPVIDTFVPATKAGVAVPDPPLATGSIPDTPVVKGKPVALVNTPDAGVPSAGVIKVGEVFKTTEPVPVLVATPVPPCATAICPEIMPLVTTPLDPVPTISPDPTGRFSVTVAAVDGPTKSTVPPSAD